MKTKTKNNNNTAEHYSYNTKEVSTRTRTHTQAGTQKFREFQEGCNDKLLVVGLGVHA